MIPTQVTEWLAQNQYGHVVAERPVAGGCINNGGILKTESGVSFFLKRNPSAPLDMFQREVDGLTCLQTENGPRVPAVYCFGQDFLLLEDLKPGPRTPTYWQDFGQQLASLHAKSSSTFGFSADNYIGSTPQPNPKMENGFDFFAQHRLIYLAQKNWERQLLDRSGYLAVEKLAARLPELIPEQPASLLHGDLWSGNALTDADGNPAIIDPAAYYGWAEAELAMTTLFGVFPKIFFEAYEAAQPLEPGYAARFPIYNLYHLLNHLFIFGRGYLGQVKAILKMFA